MKLAVEKSPPLVPSPAPSGAAAPSFHRPSPSLSSCLRSGSTGSHPHPHTTRSFFFHVIYCSLLHKWFIACVLMYKGQKLFKINPTERIISVGKMYLDLISLLGIIHYIIALNRSCTHKFSLASVSGYTEHSSYTLGFATNPLLPRKKLDSIP